MLHCFVNHISMHYDISRRNGAGFFSVVATLGVCQAGSAFLLLVTFVTCDESHGTTVCTPPPVSFPVIKVPCKSVCRAMVRWAQLSCPVLWSCSLPSWLSLQHTDAAHSANPVSARASTFHPFHPKWHLLFMAVSLQVNTTKQSWEMSNRWQKQGSVVLLCIHFCDHTF